MLNPDSSERDKVSESEIFDTDDRDVIPDSFRDVLEYWETLCDSAFAP